MTDLSGKKTGLVLLAMGGPEKLSDVRQYLYNIFSDREIIQLPGGRLFQKPFATMISKRRAPKVEQHYKEIGGGSPLLKWTQLQADQIAKLACNEGFDLKAYVAMRYFHPLIEQTIAKALADGCRQLIFLPMYPQYCKATTGSSLIEVRKALKDSNGIEPHTINNFHDCPAYINLLKEYIDKNINEDETLLFSAHSIPQKFVDQGDPYVDQTRKTAALAAGDREYFLSFQSRTGPVKWVGPNTIEEAIRLSVKEKRKLFVVPISFVCDHIETLHEIDIELTGEISSAGGCRMRRMPMFNDDPKFSALLYDLVKERLTDNAN